MATIVFFPEGAFGPTNNCVGIGQVLQRRGHRVVFIVEESFAAGSRRRASRSGLMRLGPASEAEEVPGQFWIDFIRDTAPIFRKQTVEQLSEFIAPTWQALIDGAKYVDSRLREIIDELDPDVIVEDNVVGFPALPASDRPWVRIASCNPAELKDPAIPPFSSGYPVADRNGWPAFSTRSSAPTATCGPTSTPSAASTARRPRLARRRAGLHRESPWLNLYLYPGGRLRARAAARADVAPPGLVRPRRGSTWTCRTASAAATAASSTSPWAASARRTSSSCSGSSTCWAARDTGVIVSKGPLADQITLRDNMVGEAFLPQPAILPQVDVVITTAATTRSPSASQREADGRAAPLLGPGRQRPAARRDRLRRPALDLRLRRP
jgi:hypothetical protein